jgi:hypothetical protein
MKPLYSDVLPERGHTVTVDEIIDSMYCKDDLIELDECQVGEARVKFREMQGLEPRFCGYREDGSDGTK